MCVHRVRGISEYNQVTNEPFPHESVDFKYILVLFLLPSYLLVELTNSRCAVITFSCSSVAITFNSPPAETVWKYLQPDDVLFFYHYSHEVADIWQKVLSMLTIICSRTTAYRLLSHDWSALCCCCALGNPAVKNARYFEGWRRYHNLSFHTGVMKSSLVQNVFKGDQPWECLAPKSPCIIFMLREKYKNRSRLSETHYIYSLVFCSQDKLCDPDQEKAVTKYEWINIQLKNDWN